MSDATSDATGQQERVFAYLTDPVAHPEVHRIDTHAASVFLEGDRALKIKRAVRYPYLDYSTLALRKAACDEEISINRRFAPQIYHRVVAITQGSDGSLSIGGDGTPVEYAVEMARFDERRTLELVAEAEAPDVTLVDHLAEAIAASHRVAAPAAAEPWIASIPAIIAGNRAAFRDAARFPPEKIDDLDSASQASFERLRPRLAQRGQQGLVRRCHGDLHLGNIVLIDRKPVLFDAIEFDARIASIDVLYDLAFPVMDLLRYGRLAAANRLLNRYLELTAPDHLDGLECLPLFMSLRAAIRAEVLLARLQRSGDDHAAVIESSWRYFELARTLMDPDKPMLVAVGGLSGTGKSVLARALAPDLAPQPGAIVLRSDALRKQLFGVPETARLPESAYRTEITRQVYQTLAKRAQAILAQGHSVVVDAVFADAAERAAIAAVAQPPGLRFVGLFLVADLATRQSRVGRRQHDASDATPEIAGIQESYVLGRVDWVRIDASGTREQSLRESRAAL
jgi:aminoglycoside phosphotransferase family enzyme/predicted kinase